MARVVGLVKLERKLKRLPAAAKAEIRKAMEDAATEIVAMMKRLVPVDKGDLRDSIAWTWGRAPAGSSIVAVAKASIGGDMTITIYAGGPDAFHARWVEHGTEKMPAQPYFYVSWRASRKPVRRAIAKATRTAARRVAAGG